eukprot:XP_011670271.1 PREDICTED: deleted in malignant brain tumors 1 protein-like [Strongylocentrotus purpuratus]
MLGFDGALDAPGSARFGQGSSRILLDRVNCDGTEDNLAECGYSVNALYSCSHTSDAGAMCYSGVHPNPFKVRLVGGSNDAEGRVELLHGGSWGTICDDSWDLRDARVVCRMLGFGGALDAPGSARFGQGAGPHPNPFEVRLVGGSNDAEGRVEIMHDGSSGTICDYSWDLRDARVVCRMLGFDGALDAPGSARFGQGSGRILLVMLGFEGALAAPRSARFGQGSGDILRVICRGTEDRLQDCSRVRLYSSCEHRWDAGAMCYSGAHPNPLQIRLVGGSNDAEGRVEIMHDGSWGTICDVGWDLRDARVVCRMQGFDGAMDATGYARFGQGSGRILLANARCEGTEGNLADCAHNAGNRVVSCSNTRCISYVCSHNRVAGVICYSGAHPNPFQVRLFGGSNDAEGTVEVMHDGSWGTICDYSWDLRDARVVCRMLGFDGSLDAPRSARFGQGSSQILLSYVECEGTEDNLADCAHVGIERYSCIHTRDAGAICYSGAVHPSASNVRGLDNGYAAVRAGLVLRPGGYNMTSKNQGK